jgi:hypothetical protein
MARTGFARSRSNNFIISRTNQPILIEELPGLGPLIEARRETEGATRHQDVSIFA